MLYGYRIDDDVVFPAMPNQRDNTSMQVRPSPADLIRNPVASDLGVTVRGQTMPFPDTLHGPTVQSGLMKRVLAKLPDPKIAKLRRFQRFVRSWCRTNLKPLDPNTDLTVELWLSKTNYPAWRREELRKVARFHPGDLPSEYFEFKSFIKPEFYPEIKYPRTIQSPTDELLVALGPVIKAIEEEVFKHPAFIKKIPVADRPGYIMNLFEEAVRVAASDFSSFEVSFQTAQFQACELILLEWMTSLLPDRDALMKMLTTMEIGKLRLVFKFVTAFIVATRKSGTHTTSLGNGFTNLMVHEFAGEELRLGVLTGIFEGDDGLFYYSSGRFPSPEFYEDLGFAVKLELHDSVATASFCGIVFDPREGVAIADPVSTLMRLGWGHACYYRAKPTKRLALLRCKAMSLAAQNPRAPVLAAAADWILRCTRSIDHRWVLESRNTTWWQREQFGHLTSVVDRTECGPATRQLVEEKFGVTVEEQRRLETWFDSQDSLRQIEPTWFNDLWADMDDKYSRILSHPSLDRRPVFPDSTDTYLTPNYVGGLHGVSIGF